MTPTSAGWNDELLVITSGAGVTAVELTILGLDCWGFNRVLGGGISEEDEGLRRVGGAILTLLDQTLEEELAIRL